MYGSLKSGGGHELDANQISELKRLDPADAQYAATFAGLLIAAARQRGASDIHVQPTPDGLSIRTRVDGVLVPLGTFSAGTSTNIVVRLKVLSSLLTYRTDVPQEGRIQLADQSGDFECRVSTFPTLHGERAVIRMFTGKSRFRRLDDLQLPEEILVRLRQLLGETSGAILITGPAGSGKTTTLYACLNELVEDLVVPRSIVTLEDPIEMVLPGVSQSQVNDGVGFTLATAVRSVLRQDPDIVMVGEIRDGETAKIACQAANTGHMVFSTLHANDTIAALFRLIDLGVEPFLLSSSISAILGQRLIRKLCVDCKEAYKPTADLLQKAGLPADKVDKFYRPPSSSEATCPSCNGLGYSGRVGLFELLLITDRLRDLIRDNPNMTAIKAEARKNGMLYMREEGLRLVVKGTTSIEELLKVVK